mgnify:CR=1 FL=1
MQRNTWTQWADTVERLAGSNLDRWDDSPTAPTVHDMYRLYRAGAPAPYCAQLFLMDDDS